VSKEDPKHGRWILPLVVVGLIAFTVVFVRALPAADVAQSTTTTSSTTTTTIAASTTTSTLPAEIRAFLNEVDRFDQTAKDLRAQLDTVNTQWDNDEIDFDTTLAGFQAAADAQQVMANEVAATAVPEPFRDSWPDTITLSLDLVAKADAVIEGLRAPDDGEQRAQAVADYDAAVDTFLAQLATVRAATPSGDDA
jgi:hypothetical protein